MLVLVPVPTCALQATAAIWLPFVERIAQRTRQNLENLVGQILSNEVQVHLAWEPETQTAHALAGTRIVVRGDARLGEIVWTTGMGRRRWLPLLADLEAYHREHLGCAGMIAVARPGWSKELRARGYRLTHVMMEKDFF